MQHPESCYIKAQVLHSIVKHTGVVHASKDKADDHVVATLAAQNSNSITYLHLDHMMFPTMDKPLKSFAEW